MLTKGMKPKEHFWSAEIIKLIENTGIKMTNRVGQAFLNRLMHRDGEDSLKMKTLSEMCDRHGNEILDYLDQHAQAILSLHHFDPDTGKPLDDADIAPLQEATVAGQQMPPETKERIEEYIAA